ncbi:anhydro-N-acetylmuramic acid kinase [Azorhizobium oxalatiphilum]|uniref:Anhydro-N-acetylmuramic acid kinase n=1 Tax=Azorhizobium oxalatiphilum TaxID=980631 RepID=A0A917C172_9HYPH|nr:anhydro-N-acetylmuramic acid kinase [Azorhizobium oxalatiphilum]GGF65606.1 anhydro-N-acetylmuramic acid kinase [Azorhizobium oxalatiphilum]
MRAIGLMSGTSMDGIDAALIETDGETVSWLGSGLTLPYDAATRALLEGAMADARGVNARDDRPGRLAEAESRITTLHGEAVRALMETLRLTPSDIDVVGFHGQTVIHRPDARLTVQIGLGQALADDLSIPVVADFRAADVAVGGQGAPLVPVFHQALVRALELPAPVAVLNIGGVANVTVLEKDADPIACDTGPGNALIDDFMAERTGRPYDESGRAAAAGRVDEEPVKAVLAHPFFTAPPPKSLDRNEFKAFVAERLNLSGLSTEDGAATLTAVTARTIAALVPLLPRAPQSWIVAGGGARNPTLLTMLEAILGRPVRPAEAVGWSADALEAHAFGFLAVRSLRGLPLTFPTTTGIAAPLTGGVRFSPRLREM